MKKTLNTKFSGKFDLGHVILSSACVFLAGIVIGIMTKDTVLFNDFNADKKIVRAGGQTYVSVKNLSGDFKVELEKDNEFAVFNGKTWIPVDGVPVELIVLNDKNCGKSCDSSQAIATLRQVLTPALLVREVDINSSEGAYFKGIFDLNYVPAFILGDGFPELTKGGEKVINQLASLIVENKEKYLIKSEAVGFPVGKYIKLPKFNLSKEPKQGRGKVRIVEFTDYQCPYCRRLHDQNKDLIKRLIKEGKITYYVKDFPLGFHKESMSMHIAANCVQILAGDEKYWQMNDKIFETQSQWSGKGADFAKSFAEVMAKELGVNEEKFGNCTTNLAMKTEIEKDMEDGKKFGVTGTPALFIGTKKLPGAIGPAVFEEAVESEL